MTINSIGLFVVATLLYLTIRQVGLILGRMGPIGARSSENIGPRVGENLNPFLDAADIPGKSGKPTLYIFGSSSCGICKKIKSAAESLAKYWRGKTELILVYDPMPKGAQVAAEEDQGSVPIVRSSLRTNVGVNTVPFAIMVDSAGIVLGKGLVNEMSHIESLLELTHKS